MMMWFDDIIRFAQSDAYLRRVYPRRVRCEYAMTTCRASMRRAQANRWLHAANATRIARTKLTQLARVISNAVESDNVHLLYIIFKTNY